MDWACLPVLSRSMLLIELASILLSSARLAVSTQFLYNNDSTNFCRNVQTPKHGSTKRPNLLTTPRLTGALNYPRGLINTTWICQDDQFQRSHNVEPGKDSDSDLLPAIIDAFYELEDRTRRA